MGSPLVQVIFMPMSIISILHMPIIPMQHMHMGMPFIMQHIEHMPPCIIMHICCIITADCCSAAVQVIIMPPSTFSITILQRGAIIPGIMPMPIPGIIMFMPGIMGIMPDIIWGIIMLLIMPGIIPPIAPAIGFIISPVIPRVLVIMGKLRFLVGGEISPDSSSYAPHPQRA
jgi:hypothetical protein